MTSRDRPMMACGHRANATYYHGDDSGPSCAICAGIDPGAIVIVSAPSDLTGRTARCTYYGRTPRGRSHEGPCRRGGPCMCERPSAEPLAFFHHQPDQPHDRYYCGCWGWD